VGASNRLSMDAPQPTVLPSIAGQPLVAAVRDAYTGLCAAARQSFAGDLAGRFILCSPLERGGSALVLAASIAGAASLTVEPSAQTIRDAVRHGVVDFAVNTLDEALRILKNEIRKRQAICVLLQAEPTQALASAAERGAQPDLIAWFEPEDASLAPFLQRGAVMLSSSYAGEGESRGPRFPVTWRVRETSGQSDQSRQSGHSGQWLRRLDALAAAALPEDDAERRHWITRAPRYLPRALRSERFVDMDASEASSFCSSVEEAVRASDIHATVEVQLGQHAPARFERRTVS
jgi:urocanate hydratase